MRLLARKPACADREPDAPERWNERVSIRRAGVRGGRPAAERARRSVRSLISAIFILNTRSEDGQRQTPPDCLCSRHPTSPSARQFPVIRPEGISAGQSRARFCAGGGPLPPARSVSCLEPVPADVPDARIRQHRNTYRQRFFLTGRRGGLARRLAPACPEKSLMLPIRASGPEVPPIHTAFRSEIVK